MPPRRRQSRAGALLAKGEVSLLAAHAAASDGELEKVERWLDDGGSAEASTPEGMTLLMAAWEHVPVLHLLLRRSASIDAQDSFGRTALMFAAREGEHGSVVHLLRARTSLDFQGAQGETALMLAAKHGRGATLKLLLHAGANATLRDEKGRTARDWCPTCSRQRSNEWSPNCAQLLRKHERSPLPRLPWLFCLVGTVPWAVMRAAADGVIEPVASWIAQGGCVDALARATAEDVIRTDEDDFEGVALLHVCAGAGHVDVVRLLLEHKANIDLPTDEGATPLIYATESLEVETVQLLLRSRANPELRGNCQWPGPLISAMHATKQYSHLIRAGNAVDDACTAIVETLLEARADANVQDFVTEGLDLDWTLGMAPLAHAASEGRVKVVEALLRAGASVDAEAWNGVTALEEAAMIPGKHASVGHLRVVEVLLKAGAQHHEDALEAALDGGHVRVARALQHHARQLARSDADREEERRHRERAAAQHEEEERQQENVRAAAAVERTERLARLAAMEAANLEEAQEADGRRRQQLQAQREERAQRTTEDAAPGPSHRAPLPSRKERPAPSRLESLARQCWIEEKPLRASCFAERQHSAHAQAVARRAQARRDAKRAAAAEADTQRQARLHVLPDPATLANFVSIVDPPVADGPPTEAADDLAPIVGGAPVSQSSPDCTLPSAHVVGVLP